MNQKNIDKKRVLQTLVEKEFKIKVKIISNNGKPVVFNNTKKIFCSASDSRSILFFGVSKGREIGVDVEFLKKRNRSLVKSIANQDEINLFKKYDFADTIIWSLKESAQKADNKIHDPKKYIISIINKKILIKRSRFKWESIFYISSGYVFCISLKTL